MRAGFTLALCVALAGCGGSDAISPPPDSHLPPEVKIAYTFLADASLIVLNTGTHVQRTVSDSTNEVAWSPDGSKLAYARVTLAQQGTQTLYAWTEASGQSVQLDQTAASILCDNHGCYTYWHPFAPAWSPDSREIAYVFGTEIRILSADGSSRRVIPLPTGASVQSVRWTSDGRFVTYVDYGAAASNAIVGVPATGSGSPVTLVQAAGGIDDYEWSPDSKRVVVTGGGSISVYQGNALIGSTALGAVLPRWSPDGSRIAFYGANSDPADIYTINANGSDLRRVTYGDAGGAGLAWTSDGTMLAFDRSGLSFAALSGGAVFKLLDDVGVFSITHP